MSNTGMVTSPTKERRGSGYVHRRAISPLFDRRLDHRHDAGLHRLGQLGPGIDHCGQVEVIPVPGTEPAPRWRNRRLSEDGLSRRRQPGRWNSSTSIYPLTTRAPSGGTGRVKVRRAHRNGHSPGHDSRLRTSVYGIPRWGGTGVRLEFRRHPLPGARPDPPRAGCLRNARP